MAVSNKTYNNVINTLLRIGEYHEQISSTSVGDIWEINLEKDGEDAFASYQSYISSNRR